MVQRETDRKKKEKVRRVLEEETVPLTLPLLLHGRQRKMKNAKMQKCKKKKQQQQRTRTSLLSATSKQNIQTNR